MASEKTTPRKKPPGYIVEKQVGHLLRRAHQRHCGIFAETIGRKMDKALTPVQFAALSMIQQCESVSQNHLCRLIAMDPATIQGVVGRLSERGLILSTSDPEDRRRHLWCLTPSGKSLLKKLIPVASNISAATLAPLSERERLSFLRLLEKLS